jgi:large subunit ribosomal protein L7/L12
MSDNQAIVDQLSNLTVLQIADLVKSLEEKWGVSAAAPVAVAAAGGAAGAPAAAVEEKTNLLIPAAAISESKFLDPSTFVA